PVEMHAEHVEAGRRSPVAEQAGLDVLALERLFQQGVVQQINLSDGQGVQGSPVGVETAELCRRERFCRRNLAVVPNLPFCFRDGAGHGAFLRRETFRSVTARMTRPAIERTRSDAFATQETAEVYAASATEHASKKPFGTAGR